MRRAAGAPVGAFETGGVGKAKVVERWLGSGHTRGERAPFLRQRPQGARPFGQPGQHVPASGLTGFHKRWGDIFDT